MKKNAFIIQLEVAAPIVFSEMGRIQCHPFRIYRSEIHRFEREKISLVFDFVQELNKFKACGYAETVKNLVKELYSIVGELEALYPGRPFTPDGHLIGSLGECLVAEAYGLSLMLPSNTGFDALAPDGTQVEIKATQGTKVSFRSCPQHAIVVTLDRQGGFEEVYNGRGETIWECFRNRPRPSNGQYQISITKLKLLQESGGEKIEMVNG